jgi:hypothetical protein
LQYILSRHQAQGGVTEIRLLGPPRTRTMSGFFGPGEINSLVELLQPEQRARIPRRQHARIGEATILYTLQPLSPDLRGGGTGTFARRRAVRAGDVIAYNLFPISVVPVRPDGVSATQEERQCARKVACAIASFFTSRQIYPIPVDAGSAFQLLVPTVRYADVKQASERAAALLHLLDQRFSTAEAKVDCTLSDPACALALPGTLALEGDDLPDRPRRFVYLKSARVPEDVDLFAMLAEEIAACGAGQREEEVLEGAAVSTPIEPGPTRPAGTGWDAQTASRVLAGVLQREEISFRVRTISGQKHY